jgi:hypothetical protein
MRLSSITTIPDTPGDSLPWVLSTAMTALVPRPPALKMVTRFYSNLASAS